jgi:hypothetical protein
MITGLEGLADGAPQYFDTQDTSEDLDYFEDFSEFLAIHNADTIASATVTSEPPGLTIANVTVTHSSPAGVVFWVSGGTAGSLYRVVITITTAAGRIFDRRRLFRIKAAV